MRGQTCQLADGAPVQVPQFRHGPEQHRRQRLPDAGNAPQPLRAHAQGSILGDDLPQLLLDGGDLLFEEGDMALCAGQAWAGELPGLVDLARPGLDELVAAGDEVAHGLLRERRRRLGLDVVEVDELSDDSGVDAVRLGQGCRWSGRGSERCGG